MVTSMIQRIDFYFKLAMLAAQHGADSVVTIEAFSPVSHVARKIIETNGFKDRIKIVNKHSTKVEVGEGKDLDRKANILVAELFDTELIGEGAIKAYNHAHEFLMESDCICVPDSASIFIQIVESEQVVSWNTFKTITTADGAAIECPENVSSQAFLFDTLYDKLFLLLSRFPNATAPQPYTIYS